MQQNPYKAVPAIVEAVVDETSNIKTLTFRPREPIPFRAGQFVELSVPGYGEAPFTPSSSPKVLERFDITIMKAGTLTERIHQLKPGAEVGIRGPMGKEYPLTRYHGKEVLVLGGGVGLAPLRALLFALFEDMDKYKKIILRYGARTPNDIVYKSAVTAGWGKGPALDVLISVDKGDDTWKGPVGVVTTILDPSRLKVDVKNSVAVVCGPPIMMKFGTLKLLELGYAHDTIYLSMEKNMSCGIGKCGHCRLGPYYACKDGPVFTYEAIKNESKIWD
jgi:NAD(P)H-flavin reductase